MTGPFDDKESEDLFSTQSEAFIWGRGFSEWMKPEEWRVKKSGDPTAPENEEPFWKFRYQGQTHGVFTLTNMVDELSKLKDFDNIDVSYSEGPWREVFTVDTVADKLGLSRRAHRRVPILGTSTIEIDGAEMDLKTITISEGGLGFSNGPQIKVGTKIKGTLKSANLFSDVSFGGDVVYVGRDGYIGVKFNQLQHEALNTIVEYVSKFKD
ncbi:MAG: PilZ domain-containing protein [Bdellovibrionota bacterium]